MIVTLPWPDRRLNPNARIHFHERARLAKLAKEAACILTCAAIPIEQRRVLEVGNGPVLLSITFRPPDARARDLDNMLASTKAALDGLADALRVDDVRFELHLKRAAPVRMGAVEVAIAASGDLG